jgi:hypothetical protein
VLLALIKLEMFIKYTSDGMFGMDKDRKKAALDNLYFIWKEIDGDSFNE